MKTARIAVLGCGLLALLVAGIGGLAAADTKPSPEGAAKVEKSASPQTGAAPADGAGRAHAIKLHRPQKVGDKWTLKSSGTSKQATTVSVGGVEQNKTEENFEFRLEGTAEVLSVDDKGRPTAVEFTVRECAEVKDGKENDLAAAGKIVIVERKGGKEEVRAKDPQDTVPEGLRKILTVPGVSSITRGGATDDEVLGSAQPRKVGESWSINREAAAADLARDMPGLKKENVQGEVTLKRVAKVEGIECLEVGVKMVISGVPVPPDAPPGAKVVAAEIKVGGTAFYPTDPTLASLGGEMDAAASMKVSIPTGDPAADALVSSVVNTKVKTLVLPKK